MRAGVQSTGPSSGRGVRSLPGSAAPRYDHARLNALLEQAWRRGWLPRPVVEADVLIAAARKRTGLETVGEDQGWSDRLQILTQALHDEARLTSLGQVIAYGQLVAAV